MKSRDKARHLVLIMMFLKRWFFSALRLWRVPVSVSPNSKSQTRGTCVREPYCVAGQELVSLFYKTYVGIAKQKYSLILVQLPWRIWNIGTDLLHWNEIKATWRRGKVGRQLDHLERLTKLGWWDHSYSKSVTFFKCWLLPCLKYSLSWRDPPLMLRLIPHY